MVEIGREVRLFRRNSLGIGTWRIWRDSENVIKYAHASVEGGAEIVHEDTITTNQSGRGINDQVRLEMRSRISRQLDKGYKVSRDEAVAAGSTNQLGLLNPMLAHPIEKVPKAESMLIAYGGYVQRKYDGHRCLITRRDGEIYAYTRKGKVIHTIDHVIADVDRWLPDGATLDGELYIHGRSLQSLSSLIKAKQPDSELLRYHWYDVMAPSNFDVRYGLMQMWYGHVRDDRIELVPTTLVSSMDSAQKLFAQFRSEGFEGAMLRLPIAGYEDAKRSNQLLKMKAWQDEEVTVIGVAESKDGWAVLRCRRDSGEEFDTSAPGSVVEKTEVLTNFDAKYRGRRLTVEYANLTADGLPFHCVALRWHEEI